MGQGYGTVTVPYYAMFTNDLRLKGMILTAALGDLRAGTRVAVGGQKQYDELVSKARQMVKVNRGQETFLMPPSSPDGRPIVHSYETFLDKRGPDSKAVPHEILKNVGQRPILAIRDPADPLPATLPPAQEQLEEINKNLECVLLPDIRNGRMDRVAHGFAGWEEEVFGIMLEWLSRHGLAPQQ